MGPNDVTIGEVDRKLTDHIRRQDEFEKEIRQRIDDLNLITKVYKVLGWVFTIVFGYLILEATKAFHGLFKN